MNVLVIGTGGREHAIIQSLKKDSSVTHIESLCGRKSFDTNMIHEKNIDTLIQTLKQKKIDLIVIGPEKELVNGWSDTFREHGFLVFGPSQKASLLEGSKIFAKKFMNQANIPTSRYVVVGSVMDTLEQSKHFSAPYVLKADGLAGGKGVFICNTQEELKHNAIQVFDKKIFGEAGSRALLEEFKKGYELSIFVLTNGTNYHILPVAQDYKKLSNHHQGPNTGGMGATAPMKINSSLKNLIETTVVQPSIQSIQKQNLFYRGILYIGLMIHNDQINVLEYNVRFGDPECQVLLPLIKNPLGNLFYSIAKGELPDVQIKNQHSCCVVLTEKGYPTTVKKGEVIQDSLKQSNAQSYWLHAGTKKLSEEKFCIDGGRVLNAIGLGSSQQEAVQNAYQLISSHLKKQLHYRTDIGQNHK